MGKLNILEAKEGLIPQALLKVFSVKPQIKALWKDLSPDEPRDFVAGLKEPVDKKTNCTNR